MTHMIGITGTHSTGKSTFIEDVRRRANDRGLAVETVADVATKCMNTGFPILRDHTFESTLWIVSSVIRGELEAAQRNADLVLVDRPVSDALGYLEAALDVSNRTITDNERTYLNTLIGMHTRRYSLLFKTEIDQSIPLGEGRDRDLEFRAKVDEYITRTLRALDIQARNPRDPGCNKIIDQFLDSVAADRPGQRHTR